MSVNGASDWQKTTGHWAELDLRAAASQSPSVFWMSRGHYEYLSCLHSHHEAPSKDFGSSSKAF